MKNTILMLFILSAISTGAQSPVEYTISFSNATQHEAHIEIVFRDVKTDSLKLTMSRSSPGRYALHEFVKNVYDVNAFDAQDKPLKTLRPNPYDWTIPVTDGYLKVSYTLFANHADGTYSDISESHAHLNMPATFLYAPQYMEATHTIHFVPRTDLNWKIATQLVKENENTYSAHNLDYLMDSPTELSNHQTRSFNIDTPNKKQQITLAVHHRGSEADFDHYFEQVKKIVSEEIAVFGQAPKFDHNQYTFLACYLPWAYGDGMEHRNSTILTSSLDLTPENETRLLGTAAHEFFHAWNVERLRPASLEPFDYQNANMSGELWFAEGFTSYYTNLILKRAGIINEEDYLQSITPTFNYVWGSPARAFFNPVEMSYQATFVDAATSVDPVSRDNTFISYYSYGHMLGLALDLELRNLEKSLDGYFQLLWEQHGISENPYTLKTLEKTLGDYAGPAMAAQFFEEYIYSAQKPDYNSLLRPMGITIRKEDTSPYLGISIESNKITSYPIKGSPAYDAGLSKGDLILTINNTPVSVTEKPSLLTDMEPGQEITLEVERFGKVLHKKVRIGKSPDITLTIDKKTTAEQLKRRNAWLNSRVK